MASDEAARHELAAQARGHMENVFQHSDTPIEERTFAAHSIAYVHELHLIAVQLDYVIDQISKLRGG